MKQNLTSTLAVSTLALILAGCDSGGSSQDKEMIQSLQTKVETLEQQLAQASGGAVAAVESSSEDDKANGRQQSARIHKLRYSRPDSETRLPSMWCDNRLTWFF